MQNLTLTKIYREQKTSSRTGKPFTSLRIQTKEHGQKWLSGFGNKANENWKEGDVVSVEVITKGEYLNFEMPKALPKSTDDALIGKIVFNLGNIERKLDMIIAHLSGEQKLNETSDGEPMPSF